MGNSWLKARCSKHQPCTDQQHILAEASKDIEQIENKNYLDRLGIVAHLWLHVLLATLALEDALAEAKGRKTENGEQQQRYEPECCWC